MNTRCGLSEGAQLTRVISEQSRGRGLAEEDGEGGDDSDGKLVHVVDVEKGECAFLVS